VKQQKQEQQQEQQQVKQQQQQQLVRYTDRDGHFCICVVLQCVLDDDAGWEAGSKHAMHTYGPFHHPPYINIW
jgi:hypothetical protein